MDYRILGPIEVSDGDRPLALGGEKQRALLAVLLLHAGETVSADRLIDELWGERAPPGAPKALQAHISRLRKALDANGAGPPHRGGEPTDSASGGVLLTRGRGYQLEIGPGELDLDRFQTVVEEGHRALLSGDPQRAADMLRAGLALWRGPPLADLEYEPFAQAPIAELEELRLVAIEDRVEADLALGRHEQLVAELAALVKQNPLRERLRMQLMLALYRSGRQPEALDVYQDYRRGLARELGLDPSQRLQQLEAAILERDPSLTVQVAATPRDGASVSGRRPRRAPRGDGRIRRTLGAASLIAAVLAGAVLLSRGSSGPSTIAADSVGAISPSGGAITASVSTGSSPSTMAAGEGAIWVANYNDDTVSRIDQATHAVEDKIQGVSTPSGIAVGAGGVWVANTFAGTVSRINPAANRVVARIPVGNGPSGVAVGTGSVWVANSSDGTLSRIDPVTDMPKTIPLAGGATDVAFGYDAVWVSDEAHGQVLRIDPRTNQEIQPIDVGAGPTAIAVGYDSVWVVDSLDGTVSRINPLTNEVAAKIPVGRTPNALAVGAGGVWVANEFGGNVVRIDPKTNSPARTVTVGNSPRGIAVAGGLVWVGAQAAATRHRGGTLVALQNSPFGSLDPATVVNTASIMTLLMTNDGLTTFKHVGGSDGSQVVPDLAVSLPSPTDGGLTYVFQLRRGIRYSNGQPVRPGDFRRAIQRDFVLSSALEFDLSDFLGIVGAAQCVAHPHHCDLSHGIGYDDAADTVTFHLTSPDPEFRAKLAAWGAAAVPAASPLHDVGRHPLPATGPYEVASATRHQVVLVRNPYFHEWSHAAQPDGYPDRIVWKIGASVEAATTAVERGTADYTLALPANRLDQAQTQFTNQLHVSDNDETIVLGLNNRRAPFNDVRVRRALNYAVNRTRLARLLGQDSRPACQFVPPYISGYERYCPYTLNPDRAGDWSAPNLAKAHALIAASGTRGTPITIWDQDFPEIGMDFTAAARNLKALLELLGYPTHIKTLSVKDLSVGRREADSRTAPQAFFGAGVPLYPAASQFLATSWGCHQFIPHSANNPNTEEFCDPRFDAMVRKALAAEAAGSPSSQLWADADHELANHAPDVYLANPSTTDFVSRRAGNYQYNPWLGILIDQLWVR